MTKPSRVLIACVSGIAAMILALLISAVNVRAAGADHVRWDIIHLAFTTPPTATAGGEAFASADASHTIRLTGTGTFVAPPSSGISGAVAGGGTWTTFTSGVMT